MTGPIDGTANKNGCFENKIISNHNKETFVFKNNFFVLHFVKKNQLQGVEKIMKALKILKTQEFVIHITHYKILNIFEIIELLQNIFSEFLN